MPLTRRGRLARTALVVVVVLLVAVGLDRLATHRSAGSLAAGSGRGLTNGRSGPATPAPSTPAPSRTASAASSDPFRTAAVTSYLATRQGDIGAAIYDRQTGVTYCYRAAAKQNTASIVKVDILATLLSQATAAHQPLDAGQQSLATTMIENSDNDSATSLWDEVGASTGVAAFNRPLQMTSTTPNPDGYWGLTRTTACDQVKLLRAVAYPSAVLDTAARSYELDLMSHVESDQRWGVPGGVPAGVAVAVKNGWLPQDNGWQVNSDGYVHGDGRDYVISVMTSGDSTEAYGIATIQALSRSVWDDLSPATPSTG